MFVFVLSGSHFLFLRCLLALLCLGGSDSSIGKEALPQNTAAHSKDELSGSDFRLADESMGDSHCEPEALDSLEPALVSAGRDTDVKDGCNNVTEEINTVPHDITNKPVSLMLEHLHAHIFY